MEQRRLSGEGGGHREQSGRSGRASSVEAKAAAGGRRGASGRVEANADCGGDSALHVRFWSNLMEAKVLIARAGGIGASGGEGCGCGKTLIADGGADCSFPDPERGDCRMLATYQPVSRHGAEVEAKALGLRRVERRAGARRW